MRSRLAIAAQAIGVAVLGVIVYVAFLSPTDSGPLSGIDVQPPADEQQPAKRHAKRDQRPDKPKRGRTSAGRPASPLVGGPSGPNAGPGIDSAPDSPADDQYSGTAARILARVAEARR